MVDIQNSWTDAKSWYDSLSEYGKQRAAPIYAYPEVFELIFKRHFPSFELDKIRAKLVIYPDFYNTESEPDRVRKNVREISDALQDKNVKQILIAARVNSLHVADATHIVALKFDQSSRQVFHQDSQGDFLRVEIRQEIAGSLPDYSIVDHKIKQQRDYNCTLLCLHNLISLARSEVPNRDIDDNVWRWRSEDAEEILAWGKEVWQKPWAEDAPENLRREWDLVEHAITHKVPDLPEDWNALNLVIRLANKLES